MLKYVSFQGSQLLWSYSTKSIKSNKSLSLVLRKPVFGVSNQVRQKPGCTATEDGKMLEISDLESRGIVLSV